MEHQDWKPILLPGTAKATQQTHTIQPKRSAEATRLAKIDREELVKPKYLSHESKQELVQRRLAEKLTQQQLDQRCSFPAHTIRDLEANKRPPSNKELQTLNRVFKCGLKLG